MTYEMTVDLEGRVPPPDDVCEYCRVFTYYEPNTVDREDWQVRAEHLHWVDRIYTARVTQIVSKHKTRMEALESGQKFLDYLNATRRLSGKQPLMALLNQPWP